ncbi:hypothetical protein BOW53_15835 [Solemya pervernicosa gill symbiont]|uniref:Zinc resistance-associated protein n=2 Tax=Gammaproteobacteria incertae sedis TaxID=118884 RepID=A0A1T2KZW4_9GAMM|nr:hypothetical protein [Candidatus Reidiella endopervernicosa]OOZ38362.1 hypothetical protein BOW53_15835 [Solemya pervernicosa gill symbiont]QKQ27875.1 hypothetical protein HUE57_17515 [Candidatus Reidiella endopervernicosa]
MLNKALVAALSLCAVTFTANAMNPAPMSEPLMSEEERTAHREKMQTMAPEARMEYMQKHQEEMQKRMEARSDAQMDQSMQSCGGPNRDEQMKRMREMRDAMRTRQQQMMALYNQQRPTFSRGPMMGPYGGNRGPMMMGPYGNRGPVMMGPYGNRGPMMMGPYGNRGPMMGPYGYRGPVAPTAPAAR